LIALAASALILACVLGLAAGPAAAAVVPNCPNSRDAVNGELPAFGRVGEGLAARVVVPERTRVAKLEVLIEGNQPQKRIAIDPIVGSTELTLPAGRAGEAIVSIYWEQDAGTLAACEGSEEFRLPVIPAGATAGDPQLPRLAGHYAVTKRYSRGAPEVIRPVWILTPRCSYFACNTRVRTAGGERGTFQLRANGEYRMDLDLGRSGVCHAEKVNRATGEVLRRKRIAKAWYVYRTVRLIPIKVGTSPTVIERFRGVALEEYEPTRWAKRFNCQPTTFKEIIRGVRK